MASSGLRIDESLVEGSLVEAKMSELAWCAFVAPCAIAALGTLYAAVRSIRAAPCIAATLPEPSAWPKVSMIVPACNEEGTLGAATRAKLSCDYPNLEVVIVEDRSTDGTARVADELAASDPRVRVLHVDELPEGWLGKVHALDQGVRASHGEWFLLSDADVHLSPTIVKRVIATAEERGLDFVAMMPHMIPGGFWLDVVIATFLRTLVAAGRLWKVTDPKSNVGVGGGTFMAVRRSVYDRSPGFEWLKLEVGDDVAFGQMMKRAGARCAVFNGPDDVQVRFYDSLGEMMRGVEKNGFAVAGQYSVVRQVVLQSVLLWLETGAWIGLAAPWSSARALSGVAIASIAVTQLLVARWTKRPLSSALVPVVGILLFLALTTRATVLALRRGGITWRGTFYDLESLRRGSRIELPF